MTLTECYTSQEAELYKAAHALTGCDIVAVSHQMPKREETLFEAAGLIVGLLIILALASL